METKFWVVSTLQCIQKSKYNVYKKPVLKTSVTSIKKIINPKTYVIDQMVKMLLRKVNWGGYYKFVCVLEFMFCRGGYRFG